jgi:hypothetical protein
VEYHFFSVFQREREREKRKLIIGASAMMPFELANRVAGKGREQGGIIIDVL